MATVYTIHSDESESDWRSQSYSDEADDEVAWDPALAADSAADSVAAGEYLALSFQDECNRDTSRRSQTWNSFLAVSFETATRTLDSGFTSSALRTASEPWERENHSLIAPPRNALIRKDEQVVYQAAWYHRLLPDVQESRYNASWWNQCKLEWNRSFWELAQSDQTLLEVFLSFAAAKESAVQGSNSSQG